jgi:hypothetical protein
MPVACASTVSPWVSVIRESYDYREGLPLFGARGILNLSRVARTAQHRGADPRRKTLDRPRFASPQPEPRFRSNRSRGPVSVPPAPWRASLALDARLYCRDGSSSVAQESVSLGGGLLMKTIGDTYVCALCGATLPVRVGAKVRTIITGKSGEANQRVIFVRGEEIHRCTLSG